MAKEPTAGDLHKALSNLAALPETEYFNPLKGRNTK